MPSSKVAPEPPPAEAEAAEAAASSSTPMPRAPILKRLAEIDRSIAKMLVEPNLDGYKTLPLHTAARRGDMREVAQLLPAHREALSQRDESGWMPLHHACCAGRRLIYRIPCATTKLVDSADRDKLMAELVKLIEAATAAAEALEPTEEPTGGDDGAGVSFSTKLARLLDDHIPDAPRYRDAPLPSIGGDAGAGVGAPASPKRGGRKKPLPPIAENAAGSAPGTSSDASVGKRAEANALRQLREEQPKGVWVEVAWVRPGQMGNGVPLTGAAAEEAKEKAFIEIILMQLHDSEYESHVARVQAAGSGVGRLIEKAPLDVAMSAIGRGLNVWPPTFERMRNQFELPEIDAPPPEEYAATSSSTDL